jgi:hypothetical protein
MGRPKRIRRTLAIQVSEPQVEHGDWTATPGQRFATGWALFLSTRSVAGEIDRCNGDPIQIAGFLAAKAAWDAHHHAINWMGK